MLGCFRELFIFEFFSPDEPNERVAEKKVVLTIVETPCHLIQVSLEMFSRDSMPSAHNPALEKREGRLHGVNLTI